MLLPDGGALGSAFPVSWLILRCLSDVLGLLLRSVADLAAAGCPPTLSGNGAVCLLPSLDRLLS